LRAQTLEDRYALARTTSDNEALELLRGIDKAPAAYADPLLPAGASDQVRRDAVALLTTRLEIEKARQGADAWKYELAETRKRADELVSIEKTDAAVGEWLKLTSRFRSEPAIKDAANGEYRRLEATGAAEKELLGRLAFRLGDYEGAQRHLS